ncbi:hypothetical protein J4M08_001074 [Salmonella enterica subsp. enterica serovar Nottingham]|nr:hypothetical protein [Salmonella enterica subsp. enterica serovar Nottingham]ECC4965906.1 hypothetical protein [Salmonella enterica]ECB1785219.1 hypothetical protein [Salmonella enterica subsp. enterica serovar Nottingham]EDX6894685.1 hypothetical protein [Salmonella enterica subsp. enterica serovar Nottingham]EHG5807110.1 hypothetical protein [Salmonella enterica subsp. enterica serovar Nottingham]
MSSNNIHLISVLSDKLKGLERQCIAIKAQLFDLGVAEQKRRDENEAALYEEVQKVIDEVLVRNLQELKLTQRG